MIHFETLNRLLLTEFPELQAKYDEEAAIWEGEEPGQHVVYGDIFTHQHLLDLLRSGDRFALERTFSFLERLAADGDHLTRELVEVSICEDIVDSPGSEALALPYCGPATKAVIASIRRRWEMDG